MSITKIGEAIFNRRKALFINQEKLCRGICSQSTLSKIENGSFFPSKQQMDALLQRLDISSKQYYALLSQEDYYVQKLKEKIILSNAKGASNEALDFLDKMERHPCSKENLIRQFILRSTAIAGKRTVDSIIPYDCQEKWVLLNKAIQITIPNFQVASIETELLCFEEVKIIVDLANLYDSMGDRTTSLFIYANLYAYTNSHYIEIEDIATIIPLLAYNYSRILGLEGRYKEALSINQYCCDYCTKYEKIQLLGVSLSNQSYYLYQIGNISESINIAKKAFYTLKSMEQDQYMQILCEYAKVHLDLMLS